MTAPAARRRSKFIDAVIDDYTAAHSTGRRRQLELQRITREGRPHRGDADRRRPGRADEDGGPRHGSHARGGDRHVHRLFGPGRGTGLAGGHLLCCDISPEWASIARAAWQEAGVADRIELRVGPGLETLARCRRASSSTSRSSTPTRPATSSTTKRCWPAWPRRADPPGQHAAGRPRRRRSGRRAERPRDPIPQRRDRRRSTGESRVLLPIGDGVSFVQKLGERPLARLRTARAAARACDQGQCGLAHRLGPNGA